MKKGKTLQKLYQKQVMHHPKITEMSASKYESRKRGPTAQAMAIMKNEAKNNYELTHLIQDLYKLRRATPKR